MKWLWNLFRRNKCSPPTSYTIYLEQQLGGYDQAIHELREQIEVMSVLLKLHCNEIKALETREIIKDRKIAKRHKKPKPMPEPVAVAPIAPPKRRLRRNVKDS